MAALKNFQGGGAEKKRNFLVGIFQRIFGPFFLDPPLSQKNIPYGLGGRRDNQGFALIYEQSCYFKMRDKSLCTLHSVWGFIFKKPQSYKLKMSFF